MIPAIGPGYLYPGAKIQPVIYFSVGKDELSQGEERGMHFLGKDFLLHLQSR